MSQKLLESAMEAENEALLDESERITRNTYNDSGKKNQELFGRIWDYHSNRSLMHFYAPNYQAEGHVSSR